MDKIEAVEIQGTYNPTNCSKVPLLELRGPFNRRAIDEVLRKYGPYSFSPKSAESKGQATFMVRDPNEASELVDTLNKELKAVGFVIRYTPQS